jgi:hypothetical protein
MVLTLACRLDGRNTDPGPGQHRLYGAKVTGGGA